MTRPEACLVAFLIGSLFALALFVEPPKWMVRFMAGLADWIDQAARARFYRGRHYAGGLTVEAIAGRLRDEARARAHITIEPSVEGFQASIREALGRFEAPEVFA